MPGKHREGEKLIGVWLNAEELALLDRLRDGRGLTRPKMFVALLREKAHEQSVEALAARVAELERLADPKRRIDL